MSYRVRGVSERSIGPKKSVCLLLFSSVPYIAFWIEKELFNLWKFYALQHTVPDEAKAIHSIPLHSIYSHSTADTQSMRDGCKNAHFTEH